MVEFVLFCLPSGVYAMVQRLRRVGWPEIRRRLGLRVGTPRDWLWALAVGVALFGAAAAAMILVPADLPQSSTVTVGSVAGFGVVTTALRAAGEEVLFRGLVGGVLVRRLGFAWGNLLQAAAFLLPHLLIVAVAPAAWPILPVQFAAGWLLGWLRARHDSILPGVVVHAASNVLAGLLLA